MNTIVGTAAAFCASLVATHIAIPEEPGRTRLDDAVRSINDAAGNRWAGRRQTPLTVDEVLDVIREEVRSGELSVADRTALEEIEASRELPPHVRLRYFTRYDDGEKFNHVWWIRLVIKRESGSIKSFVIRRVFLFSRPYTRMERAFKRRWGDSLPLLNRLSAYFADDPRFGEETKIARAAAEQLVAAVRQALDRNDLDALMALHYWDGVDRTTREFVREELQRLISSDVASINVVPRKYRGTLYHWQAFRTYEPNLPHAGYLEVSFAAPAGTKELRPLSLEIGLQNGQLRLLNYVESSFRPPKGKLSGPSTTSHLEPVGDGVYELSTTNDRVGPVFSAALANEEIWRVTFEE